MNKFFAISLFAIACGSAEEPSLLPEGSVDLGQASEPLKAQCDNASGGAFSEFGVDLCATSYNPCDRFNGSMCCHYWVGGKDVFAKDNPSSPPPHVIGSDWGFSGGNLMGALRNGWSSIDRNQLQPDGTPIVNFMNQSFTARSGLPFGHAYTFATADTGFNGQAYAKIDKGTVGSGQLNQSFNFFSFTSVAAPLCDDSFAYSESYSASFRSCHSWRVIFDYAKLQTWMNGKQLSFATQNIVTTNVLRKALLITLGYGLISSGTNDFVMDPNVTTSAQTRWDGRQSWLNNLTHDIDGTDATMHCVH